MAPTSSEIRRVDSLTSASRLLTLTRAHDPGQARGRRAVQDGRDPVAPGDVDPGRRQRTGQPPAVGDPVVVEPVGQLLLEVGEGERIGRGRRCAGELAPQGVELGELGWR